MSNGPLSFIHQGKDWVKNNELCVAYNSSREKFR